MTDQRAVPMPPGTYIRLRREAAGRSLEEVALLTSCSDRIAAHRRAQWLADIEAGATPLTVDVALALCAVARDGVLPFDPLVLSILVRIAAGERIDVPAICTGCGCSWQDPCRHDFPRGCSWARLNVCSRCAAAETPPARGRPVAVGLDLGSGTDMVSGVAA